MIRKSWAEISQEMLDNFGKKRNTSVQLDK